MKARANAIAWFSERSTNVLTAYADSPTPTKREEIEALEVAVKHLSEVARHKLEDKSPPWRPLLEAIERIYHSLPPSPPSPPSNEKPTDSLALENDSTITLPAIPAKLPAKENVVAPAGNTAAIPVATSALTTSHTPVLLSSPLPSPPSSGDPTDYLRDVGSSVIEVAHKIRKLNPADPLSFRILRVGLWLHILQPPPTNSGNKTLVPPPSETLRSNLELMAANSRWSQLLEEAESALTGCRFWLGLQHYSFQALLAMGDGYRQAKDTVVMELRSLLQRMPNLTELEFSDGMPYASSSTLAWIENTVTASKSSPPVPVTISAEENKVLVEAQKMVDEKNISAAINFLQEKIAACSSGSGRFRLRLSLAKICHQAGQAILAKALYESLEKESLDHNLDEWDPPLVIECLSGILIGNFKATSEEQNYRSMRLARLDPVAAMRLAR
jgi:type VI secretion system protein VasJ